MKELKHENLPEQIFGGVFFAPQRRHLGMFIHCRQRYAEHHCIHLQQQHYKYVIITNIIGGNQFENGQFAALTLRYLLIFCRMYADF